MAFGNTLKKSYSSHYFPIFKSMAGQTYIFVILSVYFYVKETIPYKDNALFLSTLKEEKKGMFAPNFFQLPQAFQCELPFKLVLLPSDVLMTAETCNSSGESGFLDHSKAVYCDGV